MNNTDLNPIIDLDILVYRVGFAVKDDEPIEYALSTVKQSIHNIYERFPDRSKEWLFLSGKDNFRDKIATIKVYKGNRDPSKRPKYYDEIKQYMIDHHKAVVVNGQEADDAIVQTQWAHKDKSTVIVSIDKDLRTCPGYHYNFVRDVLDYVAVSDANAFFFEQMLVGDRVDNVPGIAGLGPVKAAKLLAPCNKDVMRMTEVVRKEYHREYGPDGDKAYREIANLLWIRREENVPCPF